MPFPTVNNDMLKTGVLEGEIPIVGAGDKLPNSIINAGTGANQFVQLDGSAKLPALNGSLLTNLPAPGGGVGSMKLIQSQSASNSAQIDFSGLDSTYKAYVFEFINTVHSINAAVRMVISQDAGVSFKTTGYEVVNAELRAGASPVWGLTGDATSGNLVLTRGSVGVAEPASGRVVLIDPSQASTKKAFWWDTATIDSAYNRQVGGGYYKGSNGAIDVVRFFPSQGNFVSGIFKLYGIN